MIVIPSNIDFVDWSRTLFIDLPDLNIPSAESEDLWQDWGFRLIEENQLVSVPMPNSYSDWRLWAEYFIQNV